ncbi:MULTISPECIES: efflux transporter outer membrane subunit [Helicobacter]|uniref:Efflux transporter outer membrane subunit n=1 Tax=Helicobacter colisuis TaxID=2949739 RepID=A0ABT0TSX3_9HELI|nr:MULTISPECIES: efflux transporter outer membrane subunit [Helicobacter]MCI7047413.1 efflux transporter outer membrane subunit [Helicobacter sp.]MCL9819010.1 efflux transporter outer membrane subunit [Helicobacter colisuis]MDY4426927.1 efflux transporter outer membrane subunit [Helicobacter sp.]RAX51769.1 cation transporter [Helicobacter sp. 11-8110]
MNKTILVWIGLGLLIGGCSLSPKYEQPKANLPQDFGVEYSNETISQTWWKDFGDEYLNGIVEEALKNNYDLAVAMERVSQARSSWGYARSDRYPSLSAQGEATRNKKNPKQGEFDNYNNFSLSGILSFELDLWGRARDADRSAYATLLASKANRDTIRLSLIANVVESYFGVLTLNNQVQISQNTLLSREESYQYRKKEFEAGKISEIDMQQARSEMASVRAQLQSLLMERNAAQTALMILLGRDPQGIFNVALPMESQMLPKAPKVPVGLPSTLLEKRPDIEAAEQNLKAANFSIGVARAAYFPTISLTGLIGYASPELNELFSNSTSTWNYGGNFVSNVIDFGRTSSNVELTKSQYREMLLNYGQTLRQAFGEVRDSLYNHSMSFERLNSLNEQVEALRRTLVLAELRYREGYTNYLEVLTTQSNLFAAELTQQSANLENLSSVINIYKAFGGGWDKIKYAEEE